MADYYSWSTSRVNGNLNMWSESSNEQATFSDVTEITKEILKISEICENGFYLCRSKGLWRDKSLFCRETAYFSRFASRQWFTNFLDVDYRWIYVNYEFCRRGIPVSTKREQTLELNAWLIKVAPKEVDENQDTCAVSGNYWWQLIPVARLIEDKADASSTVNQSVIWELFV